MAVAVKPPTIQKTLISLLLMIFLPIVGIQAYIYYDRFALRTSEELQANLEVARAVGLAFDHFVKDVLHQELAIGLAATSEPPLSLRGLNALLRRSVEEYPAVSGFHWVSTDGRVLASNNPKAVGIELDDTDYIRAILWGRDWIVSNLVISKVDGRPVVAIARSVRDARGRLLGIALASVEPDRLNTVLAVERAKDAAVSLLDRNGMHVARHPVAEYTWDLRNWKKRYPEVKQALEGQEIATTVTSPSSGRKRLVGFAPVHPMGWVATASRARDEAYRPVVAGLIAHLSLYLLVTVGAFLLALALSRRISGSIATLRGHALALGRGGPPDPPPSTLAEVQEVASAFSDMAREVREREAELRESEERFRTLADNISQFAWMADETGWIFWYNKRWFEYTGTTLQEMEGWGWQKVHHPDHVDRVVRKISYCFQTGTAWEDTFPLRGTDGGYRWFLSRAIPIHDESGRVRRWFGTNTDVTEQKRAEEALRQLNEQLERRVVERTELAEARAKQLQVLVSELTLAEQRERRRLAEVLHDHLQQLLVAAKMSTEVLTAELGNDQRQVAANIQHLITQSIKTSRSLTAELSPPVLREGRLSAALEWLVGWMRENHGVRVELDIDPAMDPEQEDITVLLFQAVRELLFNVVKHGGTKSAKVEASRDEENGFRVSVIDRGYGFDPDAIRGKAKSGTGFGLFSIRERLALLGGDLEVESAPGHGASFSLVLPLHPVPGAGEKPIRVLLADDHAVVRRGLTSLLGSHSDIEVIGEASDGEAAVHMTRDLKPDVVLMDVEMPHMDGFEAIRIIHSEFPAIRIIGLSASPDEKAREIIEAGASAYVSETSDTDRLLSAIRESRRPGESDR
jgi:PAS domain S-box-containing protein